MTEVVGESCGPQLGRSASEQRISQYKRDQLIRSAADNAEQRDDCSGPSVEIESWIEQETAEVHMFDEFRRERWGGVGGTGLEAEGVVAIEPRPDPPPVPFFIRMEECGEAPREKDMLA